MKRIFIESLGVLFICFTLAIFAYEWLVYGVTTDYEFLLEDNEALAHQQLLQNIADNQGIPVAIRAMQAFSVQTEQLFRIHQPVEQLPTSVSIAFNQNDHNRIYFDDDRKLWFKLAGSESVFSYTPDPQSMIRKKVQLENNLVWIFLAISFVIYGLINIFLIFRRVRLLEQTTIQFAKGNLTVRASTSSANALGTLNQTFNEMAKRIMHLIESNRSLTNAVAHELRTPLFRIQWQAELLKETTLGCEQLSTIQEIIADTEEMEQMIDELLHYAKMESSKQKLVTERLDLKVILDVAKKRWQKETKQSVNLDIHFNSSKLLLNADKKLLIRALDNVVRNALKFTHSRVLIEYEEEGSFIIIRIHDDGPGVSEEHKAHIFEPFYVADKARNKGASGYGLGLSIVEKVCAQHKGSIDVAESAQLNGALFILKFPCG